MADGKIVTGLDEMVYHGDAASLSVSGAKVLLKNPARFAWERTHKRPATDAMDAGSIVHELLLRSGDTRIRVSDARDWKSAKVRHQRDVWRSQGLVAIHRGQLAEASRIRQAAMRDRGVAGLLSEGAAEQSMFWTDPETGVRCRGRVDWLRDDVLVDVKTTAAGGTDRRELARTAASMDWPMQAATYTDGYQQITGRLLPFLFVVIEREPPYFVRIYQPLEEDLDIGRERMRAALRLFADFEAEGWPELNDRDITDLPVARWYGRDD